VSIIKHVAFGVLTSLAVSCAPAAYLHAEGTSFTEQCPVLFSIADEFAHECLEKARFETRYFAPGNFYGGFGTPQPVIHGAYFRAVDSGSHFGLGCTLNRDRKLDFVGVYYSTKSSNFAETNTAPIRFIDYNGNVGITVNGEPTTLLLIRQFATHFVPWKYKPFDPKTDLDAVIDPHRLPPIKNCESITLPSDQMGKWYREGGFDAFERPRDDGITIKSCFDITRNDSGCQSSKYLQFLSRDHSQILFQGPAAFWYIRDSGALLMKEEIFNKVCKTSKTAGNGTILREVCDLPH
jgi:hypothetical protein